MKILKHRDGQFIMIAILMIAIMMVSIVGVMYSTTTYYRHERWEEYLTIVDNLKIGSDRLIEISLANYTKDFNENVLVTNLNKWQTNLTAAYPGFGIVLTHSNATIANGSRFVPSLTSNTMYFSNASAKLNIDITSVGLEGYAFISSAFLGVILNATYVDGDDLLLYVAVEEENHVPVTGLKKENFFVSGASLSDYSSSRLAHTYQMEGNVLRIIYEIKIPDLTPQLSSVSLAVVDNRDIKVTAISNVT